MKNFALSTIKIIVIFFLLSTLISCNSHNANNNEMKEKYGTSIDNPILLKNMKASKDEINKIYTMKNYDEYKNKYCNDSYVFASEIPDNYKNIDSKNFYNFSYDIKSDSRNDNVSICKINGKNNDIKIYINKILMVDIAGDSISSVKIGIIKIPNITEKMIFLYYYDSNNSCVSTFYKYNNGKLVAVFSSKFYPISYIDKDGKIYNDYSSLVPPGSEEYYKYYKFPFDNTFTLNYYEINKNEIINTNQILNKSLIMCAYDQDAYIKNENGVAIFDNDEYANYLSWSNINSIDKSHLIGYIKNGDKYQVLSTIQTPYSPVKIKTENGLTGYISGSMVLPSSD